jgi:DNA-binding MarR family transcriptional regulator
MKSVADLSQCLVLNTVSAARILLRRYDQKLKVYGVTVQQFALLSAIRFHPMVPVADLAPKVAMDRTSLIRSLDLLQKKGLVCRAAGMGNTRRCSLTEAGNSLLDSLFDEWSAAQNEMISRVTEEDAATYLRVAKVLSGE